MKSGIKFFAFNTKNVKHFFWDIPETWRKLCRLVLLFTRKVRLFPIHQQPRLKPGPILHLYSVVRLLLAEYCQICQNACSALVFRYYLILLACHESIQSSFHGYVTHPEASDMSYVLCFIAACVGVTAMHPIFHTQTLIAMFLCSIFTFCVGTGVRDHAGGRFIYVMGEFFLFATCAVLTDMSSYSCLYAWLLLAAILIYSVIMSCITLRRRIRSCS